MQREEVVKGQKWGSKNQFRHSGKRCPEFTFKDTQRISVYEPPKCNIVSLYNYSSWESAQSVEHFEWETFQSHSKAYFLISDDKLLPIPKTCVGSLPYIYKKIWPGAAR